MVEQKGRGSLGQHCPCRRQLVKSPLAEFAKEEGPSCPSSSRIGSYKSHPDMLLSKDDWIWQKSWPFVVDKTNLMPATFLRNLDIWKNCCVFSGTRKSLTRAGPGHWLDLHEMIPQSRGLLSEQ